MTATPVRLSPAQAAGVALPFAATVAVALSLMVAQGISAAALPVIRVPAQLRPAPAATDGDATRPAELLTNPAGRVLFSKP